MDDFIEYFVFGRGSYIVNSLAFVITLIGFVFTYWQIKKSKTAAQEAKEAVLKVREDMRRINLVSELSKAISLMNEIKRLHREAKTWKILPDRYSAVSEAIINIRTSTFDLSNEYENVLQDALVHFRTMEKQVEIFLATKQPEPNVPQYNELISEQIDKLQEIYAEVQKIIGM